MARRQYTEQEKATALAFVDAYDGNVSRAARKCNLPRVTLLKWVHGRHINADVLKKEQDIKRDLADLWEEEVRAALEEAKLAREGAGYNGLILAAAQGTDKMRLLKNEPTTINQNLNYDADDEAILAAADAIRCKRASLPELTG